MQWHVINYDIETPTWNSGGLTSNNPSIWAGLVRHVLLFSIVGSTNTETSGASLVEMHNYKAGTEVGLDGIVALT